MKEKYQLLICPPFLMLLIQLVATNLWAYETTHIIKPNANFETMATNNGCLTFLDSKLAVNSNPAIFPYVIREEFLFVALGKISGQAVTATKKLLFDDIDANFLKDLFSNKSFLSWTADTSFNFFTPYFVLSYSPYFLYSDILIYNPALPKIAIQLMERKTLRLTSGIDLTKYLGQKYDLSNKFFFREFNLSIGTTLSFFSEKYMNKYFSLIELLLNDTKDIIKFEKYSGVMADIGMTLENKKRYWSPVFSFVYKNIGSKYEDQVNRNNTISYQPPLSSYTAQKDLNQLHTSNEFDNMSIIGLGYNFKTPVGALNFGLTTSFLKFFHHHINDSESLAAKYSLGLFSAYTSYSRYAQTAGLLFSSKNLSIGILYSSEKEIKNYNISRDNAIYLNLDLKIY
ncbi:MAG: hypothetical protein HQK51_19500 [Oligoflexia bacterium]|nr:hypothetical protein [Oligoflexia bacterium]